MVKNNRTNFEGINEDNAEKARLAAEEMAREQNREREDEAQRREKDRDGER